MYRTVPMPTKSLIIAENANTAKCIAEALQASLGEEWYENETCLIAWMGEQILTYRPPEQIDPTWAGAWSLEQLPISPGILPTNVPAPYEVQIARLKKLFEKKDFPQIICAANPSAQGEYRFRLLMRHLQVRKPFFRLWLEDLSTAAIGTALKKISCSEDHDALAAAAFMRSESLWHYTMNMSRLGGVLAKTRDISVSRHLPILALLVRHEQYRLTQGKLGATELRCVCRCQDMELEATVCDIHRTPLPRMELPMNSLAKKLHGRVGKVIAVDREKKVTPPPLPFDTLELLKVSSRELGFSCAQTMYLARGLYELHGAISFYETDSQKISAETAAALPERLSALHPHFCEEVEAVISRIEQNPEVVQKLTGRGEHAHAIIPSGDLIDTAVMSEAEQKLYSLICRQFIASLCPPQVSLLTTVTASAGEFTLISESERAVVSGWTKLVPIRDRQFSSNLAYEGCEIEVVSLLPGSPLQPSARFTEASLLEELEKTEEALGIRGEITRDMGWVLAHWEKKGFLEVLDNELRPTERGTAMISVLEEIGAKVPEARDILSLDALFLWGKTVGNLLMAPSNQVRATYLSAMAEVREKIADIVERCRESEEDLHSLQYKAPDLGVCPECGGQVVEHPKIFKCANKGCFFRIFRTSFGARIGEAEVKALLSEGKTPVLNCKGKKGPYAASLAWDKESKKLTPCFEDRSIGMCPTCCIGRIVEYKGHFGCSAYRETSCDFFIKKTDEPGGITRDDVKELLTTRRTKGFLKFPKKDGTTYLAQLKLDLDGKLQRIFKDRKF